MTRLTEHDIVTLPATLPALDEQLLAATGADLTSLACMTAQGPDIEHPAARIKGVEVCVVPVTSGQGTIDGFVEAVAAVCAHLGCHSWIAGESDVAGLAFAVERGAELVLLADDARFIALNLAEGTCVDNGLATGYAYAMALNGAAGGLAGRAVLVLGLGPVGLAACAALHRLGAHVHVYDPDRAKVEVAERFFCVVPMESAHQGLRHAELVLDASPAPGLIDDTWVGPRSIVAAPGMPCGVTPEAMSALGNRLLHEPLALGVAAMVAQSCLGIWTEPSSRPPRGPRRLRSCTAGGRRGA